MVEDEGIRSHMIMQTEKKDVDLEHWSWASRSATTMLTVQPTSASPYYYSVMVLHVHRNHKAY